MIILFNPRSCHSNYRLPLSLLSLGSTLEGKYDYEIIEGNFISDPLPILSKVIGEQKADILGITVMPGPQLQQSIPISGILKQRFPSLRIVWGGYFPSTHTDVCVKSPIVDFVMRGQCEKAFPELVEAIMQQGHFSRVPNLSYEIDGQVRHNPDAELIHPDDLPSLPYRKVEVEGYASKTYLGTRTLSYHSSYGCPFQCGFCAVVPIYQARWLAKSPSRMAEDIEELVVKYGANAIEFHDNNFFTSEKRLVEFSEQILKRGIRFSWWGEGRPDTLLKFSDETFSIMKRAGLKMVFMGAESSDDATLAAMNKGGTQTGETVVQVVEKFKRHGIVPECSFVFGIPCGDVDASIEKDINFIRDLKKRNEQTEIIIYMYSPIAVEGSTIFSNAEERGFKFPEKLEEWSRPEWAEFDLRRNPMTPWIKPRHVKRVKSFEKVLNAVYPTNSDIKLKSYQRTTLRMAGAWRYFTKLYSFPFEIRLLQHYFRYRQPEIEGF